MKEMENIQPQDSYVFVDQASWKPRHVLKPIVNEVTTGFKPGNFTAILGPNGAGKTSLVKLILGFNKLTNGQIFINKKALSDYSRKDLARELAYLPQNSRSNYDLSALEVIRMARYSRLGPFEEPSLEDEKAVFEAIERAGAGDLVDKKFSVLSGGEKQRILCARAMAQESKFILLDEPVSNLDLRYQHTILAALHKLSRDKGVGIICVMHDVNLARQYSDQVLILKQGKAIAQGPVSEVLQAELLSEVYDWPLLELKGDLGENSFLVPESINI